jgi:hypothetical protein
MLSSKSQPKSPRVKPPISKKLKTSRAKKLHRWNRNYRKWGGRSTQNLKKKSEVALGYPCNPKPYTLNPTLNPKEWSCNPKP